MRTIAIRAAAAPVVPLAMFYDTIGARLGGWDYPALESRTAPFAWYLAGALWYGAALGIVRWRVVCRLSRRGLTAFLAALALIGVRRDYLYSVTTEQIQSVQGLCCLLQTCSRRPPVGSWCSG